MRVTLHRSVPVPVVRSFGEHSAVIVEDWDFEARFQIHSGERPNFDYPGSPATAEVLDVRVKGLDGVWRELDPADSVLDLIPDLEDDALDKAAEETVGQYEAD